MAVGFVGDTALDKGGAEELAVVIPRFIGEPEEGEKYHRAKYGSPPADLSGDVKGAVLDPDYLREKVDATKVVVCIRPASPGRKWVGGDVKIYLEHRYRRGTQKFHRSECHQTEVSARCQRFA